jgi:hypothetical protein
MRLILLTQGRSSRNQGRQSQLHTVQLYLKRLEDHLLGDLPSFLMGGEHVHVFPQEVRLSGSGSCLVSTLKLVQSFVL